ncbi:MAG: phage holin family protein [Chitinophagaceae bacterium]|jgi:putative membrane protein|nr:phage holin family protein [Chitinophagaceae bacterium]
MNIIGKFFISTITTSLAVLLAAYILPGVEVNDPMTAIVVAILLGLLNTFVKPILVLLTIPITIVTLGLFLLVINVLIIMWVDDIVAGFHLSGWLIALAFSFIVSIIGSVIERVIGRPKEEAD